jgi:hypothetical protein
LGGKEAYGVAWLFSHPKGARKEALPFYLDSLRAGGREKLRKAEPSYALPQQQQPLSQTKKNFTATERNKSDGCQCRSDDASCISGTRIAQMCLAVVALFGPLFDDIAD